MEAPSPADRPVLDYAPVVAARPTSALPSMRRWRSACGACLWVAVAGLVIHPLAFVLLSLPALVCATLTIVHMGRLARAEAGTGYAARQVVLAVLLCPAALLGVWLVPQLVESDLSKWHDLEARQDGRRD